MKLNKHQQETLQLIKNGTIYDLYTYIKHYNYSTFIKLDKQSVLNSFTADPICKEYYHNNNMPLLIPNLLDIHTYNQKVDLGELDSQNYTSYSLKLGFNCGIKHIPIDNRFYKIDFYNGVYIANSFEAIIDFLALWQYLKSEMLILEVPNNITENSIGLFFEKKYNPSYLKEFKKNDLSKDGSNTTLLYSDDHYLEFVYSFSEEHFTICKDYLEKRFYPTPKLNLYIQNKFLTSEERTQKSALIAAWLAIFVSVILTFAPFLYSIYNNKNANSIEFNNTNQIEQYDEPNNLNQIKQNNQPNNLNQIEQFDKSNDSK